MLEFYKTQFVAKRNYFTKEFIEGLATVRGAQINQKYAECFEVIKSNMLNYLSSKYLINLI